MHNYKQNYRIHVHVCKSIVNFQRKLNLTLLAMKTRANLQRIQSLTYAINDEHAELLQDMNSQLQHLYDTIYQQLPNKEGLAIHTNSSIRVSTIRRKVQKSRHSLNCSRLNTANPKKRSRPLGTSKRVGIRADRLRKAHQVPIFTVVFTNNVM